VLKSCIVEFLLFVFRIAHPDTGRRPQPGRGGLQGVSIFFLATGCALKPLACHDWPVHGGSCSARQAAGPAGWARLLGLVRRGLAAPGRGARSHACCRSAPRSRCGLHPGPALLPPSTACPAGQLTVRASAPHAAAAAPLRASDPTGFPAAAAPAWRRRRHGRVPTEIPARACACTGAGAAAATPPGTAVRSPPSGPSPAHISGALAQRSSKVGSPGGRLGAWPGAPGGVLPVRTCSASSSSWLARSPSAPHLLCLRKRSRTRRGVNPTHISFCRVLRGGCKPGRGGAHVFGRAHVGWRPCKLNRLNIRVWARGPC